MAFDSYRTTDYARRATANAPTDMASATYGNICWKGFDFANSSAMANVHFGKAMMKKPLASAIHQSVATNIATIACESVRVDTMTDQRTIANNPER